MNPELPSNPREELELRVTSLLLGELSETEAASVRAAIANDPELQKLHDDLKQTIHVVREATVGVSESSPEPSEPLKLSEERRKSLLAAFVIPPLKPERVKAKRWERQWLVPVAVAATILAVLGVWMFIAPRREQEGYAQLGLERASLASAQPRRVTPLAGQRPEDGSGNSDGVEMLSQPETTTVSGRTGKASEQNYPSFTAAESSDAPKNVGAGPAAEKEAKPVPDVKSGTWGKSASLRGYYGDSAKPSTPPPAEPVQLGPPASSTLAAEPKLAPPPMEIVLPKSGEGESAEAFAVVNGSVNTGGFSGGGSGGGRRGGAFEGNLAAFGVDFGGAQSGTTIFGDGRPAQESLEREDIQLHYATPSNVRPAIDALTDNRNDVQAESGDRLSIFGKPADVKAAKDLVAKLDVPSKQMLIEGRLVETTDAGVSAEAKGLAAKDLTPNVFYRLAPRAAGNSGGVGGGAIANNTWGSYDGAAPGQQPQIIPEPAGRPVAGDVGGPRNMGEEQWFKSTAPQNRGEVSSAESRSLGEAGSAGSTFTDRLRHITTKASSGAVDESGHGVHVAGTLDVNGPAAKEPAAPGLAKGLATDYAFVDGSAEPQVRQGFEVTLSGSDGDGDKLAFDTAQPGAAPAEDSKKQNVQFSDSQDSAGVPMLGDMPVLGRVFRSESTTRPATTSPTGQKASESSLVINGENLYAREAVTGVTRDDVGALRSLVRTPAPRGAKAESQPGLDKAKSVESEFGRFKSSGEQTRTDAIADSEWVGVLEQPSKPADGGKQFVGRFAYEVAPTESESLARGKRGGNIVLPSEQPPAASDQLLTAGLRESKQRVLEVEKAWDVPTSRDKLPVPNPYYSSQIGQQIAKAKDELAGEREKLGITDQAASSTMETVGSLDYNSVQLFNARLIENESRLDGEGKKLAALQKMSREQQMKALPSVEPDGQFNELSAQLNITEQALIKARQDRGLESTDYKNADALAKDLRRKLDARLDGTIAGMQARVEGLRADTETLRTKLATTKSDSMARAAETRPYYEKKRELENLIAFQKILEQRLAMEKVDVTLPRSGMVTVMNRATAPKSADRGVLGRMFDSDYKATASVKIDRPAADISEFSANQRSGVYDPYFIQTEFEAMKSDAVLTNVVSQLGLTNKWGSKEKPLTTAEAARKLRDRLEFKPVPNTMFLEIRGKSGDAKEAAELANAVAEAYQQHRLAEIKRASEGGIRALEERFVEQQAKVRKVTQELAAIRESTKSGAPATVIDAPLPRKPSTNAPVPQPEIQTSENNFSTFSLNVSDVSFKLAAASLEKGQMPDSASIRSEEFINAFDYRDPEPAAGAPVAFAWERARYPFAHNRDLLRFSLKTAAAGRQAGRPLNVVLLLDNSGSMERADRVGIIREALRVLATQLQPQDKLSVITFARTSRLVADGITGDKAGEVAEQVSGLTPEGGTNLEDAMNLAYQTAAKHYLASGINRVVVLTDGAANLGDVEPESLKQKVEMQRKQGIALDCFGIGWDGFNDDLLEVLSRNGDGRYGFINSPEEATSEFAGQLAGALKVAASDVKVQVEFNPKRVTSYRQIGYAKHQLTKEQFRDNTVDAAEIAAQEAGNALYTVEVNPAGAGPLATVHVRYKIPGTMDYREQAWDVPFNGNAVALEQSSSAMRLAASASAFSEWLAVSPHAGEVTPDMLLNYLGGVPEAFGADSRPKKLEWMIRQAKSVAGN